MEKMLNDDQLRNIVKKVDDLIAEESKNNETHPLNFLSIILGRIYTTSQVIDCEDDFIKILEHCLDKSNDEEVPLH